MPRKTYTREFKLQAVRMLTDQGLSVAEVARRLGVGENCLRHGRQVARDHGEAAFPGQGNPPAAEDELRRLRAEVQRLRAERDLLKKPPPTSSARRTDLPVHRRPPRRVPGRGGLRRPGGVGGRLLCLGQPHPLLG
jgi:transposase